MSRTRGERLDILCWALFFVLLIAFVGCGLNLELEPEPQDPVGRPGAIAGGTSWR